MYKTLIDALTINNPIQEKKDHFLFLLGTGVNYIDNPESEKFYVRGETLSYAAQVVSTLRNEEPVKQLEEAKDDKSPHYAHPYYSDSVNVVNGPDVAGFDVGHRLVTSLILALNAIAKGNVPLNVVGFSRGGAEAIVLMHELERIKKTLVDELKKPVEKQASLAEIIKNSKSVPTRDITYKAYNWSYTCWELHKIIGKQPQNENDPQLKYTLLKQLNALEVKLFVIDPVPGDSYSNKVVEDIGWKEDHYFFDPLPEFVIKKQEFMALNETSKCFLPIVSEGMPYEIVPGIHGTADGNQFDHNGDPIKCEKNNVSSVQNLVLQRLLDFILPQDEKNYENLAINLKHPELDAITNRYLPANREKRNQQLLENYKHMRDNHEAFSALGAKNYHYLGRDGEVRRVHFQKEGDKFITELEKHGDNIKFVNEQHVQLWVSQALGSLDLSFADRNTFDKTSWLQTSLALVFSQDEQSNTMMDSQTSHERLFKELSHNKNNHSFLKNSLSFLVKMITQSYLQDALTPQESDACIENMEKTYTILKRASEAQLNDDRSQLAQEMIVSMGNDLAETFSDYQYSLLLLAASQLTKLKQLAKGQLREEEPLTHLIATQTLVEKLTLLAQQIHQLQEWCSPDIIAKAYKEIIPFLDEKLKAKPSTISEIERLKQLMQEHLNDQIEGLIEGGEKLFTTMGNHVLDQKPEALSSKFYLAISTQARHDAKMRQQQETLRRELQDLETRNQTLDLSVREAQEKIMTLEAEKKDLHSSLNEAKQQINTLKTDKLQLESTITEQAESIRLFHAREKIRQLRRIRARFSSAIEDYIKYNKDTSYFAFFHFHGQTGIDRANAIRTLFNNKIGEAIRDIQDGFEPLTLDAKTLFEEILTEQASVLEGNFNKHSLKTYLLAFHNALDGKGPTAFNDEFGKTQSMTEKERRAAFEQMIEAVQPKPSLNNII